MTLLFFRVKKCIEMGAVFDITDPYPGQPYLEKKKSACPNCQTKTVQKSSKETETETVNWTKDAKCLPETFNYVNILDYSKLSGKKTKDIVEKPINRGYTLFFDGYVHDVSTSSNSNNIIVRCKCFKSMKKNEQPHDSRVTLDSEGKVKCGKCSCVAGASGFCNHVFALLYTIDHSVKLKLTEFSKLKTCTERPSQWTKARTEGVRAEPVMAATVVKPKFGNKSCGIRPLLQDTRLKEARNELNVKGAVDKLKEINPLIGLCQVASLEKTPMVDTRLELRTPVGSVLSYQLGKTEGDFVVTLNLESKPETIVSNEKAQNFPWIRRHFPDSVENTILRDLNLEITEQEAIQLEKDTKEQALSEAWFQARKYRLTASKFGRILSRKKDKDSFIKDYLLSPKNLSHVPAVQYGLQNEEVAVKKYLNYMTNSNMKTAVFKSGVVVNTALPWLAASPDRLVYNNDVGFGLLEVKCAYSKKSVTPKDACTDPGFFCTLKDGLFSLKTEHDYFAQVQGQLGICGASYCDFIVYTNKGIGVHRILYDEMFFLDVVRKLKDFFLNHFLSVAKTQIMLIDDNNNNVSS